MEPTEEQTRMSSSQGEEDEGSGVPGEALEGLASLRWQREDGRMSRREGGQRTPTTHRVNTLSNAPGGQQTRNREDSDDDDEGDNRQAMHTPTPVRRASGVVRDGQETQNDAPNNQQMGAPPGSSAPAPPTTFSTPRRPILSPFQGAAARQPPSDLYPVLSPPHQSVGRQGASAVERSDQLDAADSAFLDDDFQECWWVGEYEGADIIARGWATKQGDRALVYIAGGGLWSGSLDEYRDFHRRLAQQMKNQKDPSPLPSPKRYEAARKGAGEYLRIFRRETGGLPSRSTWANSWRGELDTGGRQITVELPCAVCRIERTVSLANADAVGTVYREDGFRCSMLRNVVCGERMPLSRGSMFELLSAGRSEVPAIAGGLRQPQELKEEVSRHHEDGGGSEDIEIVGFSSAAKQFYKAQGPQLHTPVYRGEPSEVDLLAWKRGIEKYFETYGVSRQREKVSLAADLLEGEAAKW